MKLTNVLADLKLNVDISFVETVARGKWMTRRVVQSSCTGDRNVTVLLFSDQRVLGRL